MSSSFTNLGFFMILQFLHCPQCLNFQRCLPDCASVIQCLPQHVSSGDKIYQALSLLNSGSKVICKKMCTEREGLGTRLYQCNSVVCTQYHEKIVQVCTSGRLDYGCQLGSNNTKKPLGKEIQKSQLWQNMYRTWTNIL